MKIPLTYGFFMALGGALLSLLMYFLGLHDAAEKLTRAQWIQSGVGLAISITCLALAMREKRAGHPAASNWGYGSAFGTGVLTGVFGVLLGAVWMWAYFTMINPAMKDLTIQAQAAAMEARGMPSSQVEQAQAFMSKWMIPMMLASQVFIGGLMLTALSAIVAIFFKNRPANFAIPAPPVQT